MTDHVTVTVDGCVATILWHGNNTHIRIVRGGNGEEFTKLIADALKRAFLEDHAETQKEAGAC